MRRITDGGWRVAREARTAFVLHLGLYAAGCFVAAEKPDTASGDAASDVVDVDGDGVGAADDCDDQDPSVYPGAVELCDGIDNDCAMRTSERGQVTFFPANGAPRDLTAAFATASPEVQVLDEDGELRMCRATVTGGLDIRADVAVVGDGGAGSNALDGGGRVRPLTVVAAPGVRVRISGVTISGGIAWDDLGWDAAAGGGLACRNADVEVSDSEFVGLHAEHGGAIAAESCDLRVTNTSFVANRADSFGGAVVAALGSYDSSQSRYDGNEAGGAGGAIFVEQTAYATHTDSHSGNVAVTHAGATYVLGGSATIDGSVYAGNQADIAGALLLDGVEAALGSANLSGNQAGTGGGAMVGLSATIVARDTIFGDNHAVGDGGAVVISAGTFHNTSSIFNTNLADGVAGAVYALDGADVSFTAGRFGSNVAALDGGAIYQDGGVVRLDGVDLEMNTAGGFGGGVASVFGDLQVTGAALSYNDATDSGGAVFATSGSVTMSDAVVRSNAAGNGGGVFLANMSTATITSSTFESNEADDAGALASGSNALTLDHVLFNQNLSRGAAGALRVQSGSLMDSGSAYLGNTAVAGNGGAVLVLDAAATLQDVQFDGNVAEALGGALIVRAGASDASLSMSDSSVSGGSAAAGGALEVYAGDDARVTAVLERTAISGAAATNFGGALHVSNYGRGASVTWTDSSMEGTSAGVLGSVVHVEGTSAGTVLACNRRSGGTSRVIGSAGAMASMAFVAELFSFQSDGCDFGDVDVPDTMDVVIMTEAGGSHSYAYGSNASFACDIAGCR